MGSIRHSVTATGTNDPTKQVSVDAWNDDHVVTLVMADISDLAPALAAKQNALGFTPYNSSNPNGYISSITGAMVTTALGYTPYNATNPSAYISSITSGMVTGALGYIPTSITGLTGVQTVAALKTGLVLAKADVGLGNVDNTADAAKNVLSATKLTTVRTLAATAGDVTWSGSFDGSANFSVTTAIAAGAVSLAKMANLAANSILGNNTGSAATPIALTPTQAKVLLRNACMVKKSADQTAINATAGVTLAWDAEVYDDGVFHDNVTNNTRLSVPSGISRVRVGCNLHIANGTAAARIQVFITKTGSSTYDGQVSLDYNPISTTPRINLSSGPIPVTGGTDYFEVFVLQATDTSIDIIADSNFWIETA